MNGSTIHSDALLVDAEIIQIREARPEDESVVLALHERVSARSLYLRYFNAAPVLDAYLRRLLRPPDDTHNVLVGILRGDVVAVAAYERLENISFAEVAFLVDDAHQSLGISTLLLEHLAVIARSAGIDYFVAQTLVENAGMLAVFRGAGYMVTTSYDHGMVDVSFPTLADTRFLAAADEREAAADCTSVRHVLAPESVAVVGAGRDPGGLGHQILTNLLSDGYDGLVYPINCAVTAGDLICGLQAYRSLTDIPGIVDLVVVSVPARGVLDVAAEAADRNARTLVIISAGFAEAGVEGAARQSQVLALCRSAGMRLVGPNSMGIANLAAGRRLNATFGPPLPAAGAVGLMSQSGAVGIAALDYAQTAGIGISSFVSAGNKADVSGNDLLCFWERDPATTVCALYLESFGNPRKFARIASRVGRRKPVVVVKSGRSIEGARGARSHTGAAATPEVAVDALFAQAGVIRAESLPDLFDVAALLERGPLPAGDRIAIVGNSGGPGVMAADACVAAGLCLPVLSGHTRARLTALLPAEASTVNPVDMLADTTAPTVRACLEAVLADPQVDAVIAVYTPIRHDETEAIAAAIAAVSATSSKPVVAVMLGLTTPPAAFRDESGRCRVPFHAFPETAASALGAVARYARWRDRPIGTTVQFEEMDIARARRLVQLGLESHPDGRWLSAPEAVELVSCFGIPVIETILVDSADQAAEAARVLAGPVVLKAAAGQLVHKTDVGGVHLGIQTPDAARAAFEAMSHELGDVMRGAVVQPMITAGVEAAVGVVNDRAFGPLVMFGLGGVASDLLADRAFRILPMTAQDAAAQIRSLRSSQLLFGYRGSAPVDTAALEQLLLRAAALAEAIPEVAELDLNPVLATSDRVVAVDVKVRLEPRESSLALLRRLRPS